MNEHEKTVMALTLRKPIDANDKAETPEQWIARVIETFGEEKAQEMLTAKVMRHWPKHADKLKPETNQYFQGEAERIEQERIAALPKKQIIGETK